MTDKQRFASVWEALEDTPQQGATAGRIESNVKYTIKTSTQLAYTREPAIRNFEVVGGELRVRGGREGALSLANLAVADQVDSTKILGVVLRPAATGVGASTLRRAAVSGSVMREIGKTRTDNDLVAQVGGGERAGLAALQAIRHVLGKLNLSAPEGLKGVFYSRGASNPTTVAALQQAVRDLTGSQLPNQLGRVVASAHLKSLPPPSQRLITAGEKSDTFTDRLGLLMK